MNAHATETTVRHCRAGLCFHEDDDPEHVTNIKAPPPHAAPEVVSDPPSASPSPSTGTNGAKRARSDPQARPPHQPLVMRPLPLAPRPDAAVQVLRLQGGAAPAPHPSAAPELLTTARLAQRLSRNPRTISRWRRDGCPYAVKFPNGSFLFTLEDVLAWLGTDTTRTVVDPRHREVVKAAIRAEWSRLELERRRRRRGG